MKIKKGILRIGTSNIVLPGTKKTFPEEFRTASRLTYYASLFNTVEINSSFYKVPQASTFEKWGNEVPDHFRFSVKLWRGITHNKPFTFNGKDIDLFMQSANHLGTKKGCLLMQFPAGVTVTNMQMVEKIIKKVIKNDNSGFPFRKAIEFRHISWYTIEVYELLSHYDISLVLHDMPASDSTNILTNTAFYYYRFHGIAGDYRGSYSDAFLKKKSLEIKKLLTGGKDVYTYFNNTIGDAYANAQKLEQLCSVE